MADETAARFDRRVRRRINRARFPVMKTIESYDWSWPSKIDRLRISGLFDLDFIEQKRNALFIGGTGFGGGGRTLDPPGRAFLPRYGADVKGKADAGFGGRGKEGVGGPHRVRRDGSAG